MTMVILGETYLFTTALIMVITILRGIKHFVISFTARGAKVLAHHDESCVIAGVRTRPTCGAPLEGATAM